MSIKIFNKNKPGKYYPVGFMFLLVFIFIFALINFSEAAEKSITIGPLAPDTSKILMGIAGSKVGIGGDPGVYNLYVNGSMNVNGVISSNSSMTSLISAANISSSSFGSNAGGGNYSFPGIVTAPTFSGSLLGNASSANTLNGLQLNGPYSGWVDAGYYHLGSWNGNGWGAAVLVDRSRYADSAGSAPASGGNSDSVDNQHFTWSNRSNGPTYVWAADNSGDSYLSWVPGMSVNYANSAGALSGGATASDIYNNGWFRNNNVNQGLYNQAVGAHFYASAANVWNMGGGGAYPQLIFRDNHQSTIRGYIYSDSSGFGMLNNGGNWMFYTPYDTQDVHFPGSIYSAAFIYNSSDRNLKKNIATIKNPLEKIMKLRGVTFNWKKDNSTNIGLIAQEVEQVFPELITGTEGNKAVAYSNLVAPLIEAVKAQQVEITRQNDKINNLNMTVQSLNEQLKILQKNINKK